MNKPKIKDLTFDNIVDLLGGIYEHSQWVVQELVAAHDPSSFSSVSELAAAMKSIVDGASREQKMDLLLKHPDLCQKVEQRKELTADSQAEQSKAGLSDLTAEELELFNKLNDEYKAKFGFPFILAVRNASKYTVLSALAGRVKHTVEKEFVDALAQVHKIAWMRLLDKVDYSDAKGYLTCHVLDTANGIPGKPHYLAE
jgi:2-oxo-4-hydroxy-4-carboxy-5-ureidoimidazoline decarboxylase